MLENDEKVPEKMESQIGALILCIYIMLKSQADPEPCICRVDFK